MDTSPILFQKQLSSKSFMSAMVLLLKKGVEYQQIQLKVLYLIKKWANQFESKNDLAPNFNETYKVLIKSGCIFPKNINSEYSKYIDSNKYQSQNSILDSKSNPMEESNLIMTTERSKKLLSKRQPSNNNSNNNYGEVRLDLTPQNYPQYLRLLVSEIPSLLEYVILDNEMIDNFDYSKKKIDEGIVELTQTIQDIAVNLKKTIEKKISHEKLIGICLGILEDLETLSERYQCIVHHKQPKKFVSCFMKEYSCYNLNLCQSNNLNTIAKMMKKNDQSSSSGSEESGEEEDNNDNDDELIK